MFTPCKNPLYSLTCVILGLKPDIIPELLEVQMVALAVEFWGDVIAGFQEIDPRRYKGKVPLVILNGSGSCDNTHLGKLVRKARKEGTDEVAQKIRATTTVGELISLISPSTRCAWNFEHVESNGTFVFQLPPACVNAHEVHRWVEFAVGFVRAALNPKHSYDHRFKTRSDLENFVTMGLNLIHMDNSEHVHIHTPY